MRRQMHFSLYHNPKCKKNESFKRPTVHFFILRERIGKQCPWIAIRHPALPVEGIPQAPINAEFHSAATRSANAFDHDQLTAGRGLFLFGHRVPPPFLRADPHWPLPPAAPAFPHGSAGTRHSFYSFHPRTGRTQLAAP